MPQYPPASPAGDWLAGLRVGAAQAWLGRAASRALRTLRSCPVRPPPVASGLDSDSCFICLDSPIPAPACPLATRPGRLWEPLFWPGHWLKPEMEQWMAVDSRARLGAEGPQRGQTLLCAPWLRPWGCMVRALAAVRRWELSCFPRVRASVALGGVLFLNCAGFSSRPGLEGGAVSDAPPPWWVFRLSVDLQAGEAAQREFVRWFFESHFPHGVTISRIDTFLDANHIFKVPLFPKFHNLGEFVLNFFFFFKFGKR